MAKRAASYPNYNEFLGKPKTKRETQTSVLMEIEDSDTEQISNIVQLLAKLTRKLTLKVLNNQIRASIRTSQ